MNKPTTYRSCTVQRTFVRGHGHLVDGKYVQESEETVTEPCNVPLFDDLGQQTGICRSCRGGWEAATNKFASEAEMERAMYS